MVWERGGRLWERTPEQVTKGLLEGPLPLEALQKEPYRSIFLDASGNFRKDRIPELRWHRARSLHESSEEAARAWLSRLGVQDPKPWEVLATQRELGDWYVGGLWVPGVGYIGEVWAPVYGLPYDESGNAGGITAWFMDFPAPQASLPYEGASELYWARLHLDAFSVLLPERGPDGQVLGFTEVKEGVRTGYTYLVAWGDISPALASQGVLLERDFDGLPLVLEGQPIRLIRKEE